MKIQINDHRKIYAIQEEFGKFFPGMKIEFLARPSKVGNPPSEKIVRETSKTLGECRVVHNKGELTLSAFTTVADLQQTLADTYGLSIIILQRSGNEWIETTPSDRLNPQPEIV